jgi:hypothetical protein
MRKDYVHRFVTQEDDLFPSPEVSDNAVALIREAVTAIYSHVGRTPPAWIQDNEDRGWDKKPTMTANLTVVRKGACLDDPDVVKICYVKDDEEHLSEVLAAGTDSAPYVDDLLQRITVPISAIRVYEGDRLVFEKTVRMRGGD